MNIRKCENDHFYNGDRYKVCPYCEEAKLLQNPDTEKQENVKKEKADKKKEPKVRPVKKKYVEKDIRQDYRKLTELLIEWNMSITTMESATAGQIANETKIMQGVSAEVIHKYTVYSKETAEAMATACANMYGADIGIGVTGTMGNTDPDNADASVPGQVYFAISLKGSVRSYVVEIPQQPSRLMYKLAVAKEVYDVLMRLFE